MSYSQSQDFSEEEEHKKQRRSIQMEMIMLESDMRKLTKEKSLLEAEIRKLKQDGDRIRVILDEKRKRFDYVSQEVAIKEEDLKKERKKLNLL